MSDTSKCPGGIVATEASWLGGGGREGAGAVLDRLLTSVRENKSEH